MIDENAQHVQNATRRRCRQSQGRHGTTSSSFPGMPACNMCARRKTRARVVLYIHSACPSRHLLLPTIYEPWWWWFARWQWPSCASHESMLSVFEQCCSMLNVRFAAQSRTYGPGFFPGPECVFVGSCMTTDMDAMCWLVVLVEPGSFMLSCTCCCSFF